ncbi:Protein XRP2 [Cryptotermes secundus]|uniref:Protein XRP2 n=1 Tax=Cryptotermes secundus TaxID=105785 RepID=A0A2J7QJW1_9NEOP|nr:Protein XRP2 [Cryptotermes secundus]
MGCLFHKGRQNASVTGKEDAKLKEYSWDKRNAVNLKDYTVENTEDGEVLKMPGSVNGQQFVIQNCKNTCIYIFDHANTVTVDDCINCKIILAAVKGSVFLRDCKECVCVIACGQFRTRDCRKMDIFLCCATQPIIEASSSIHFGCYQLFYTDLEEHFQQAGLSVFNNNWSSIHDFTPIEGENNWCLFPDTIRIQDYISLPASEELQRMNTSLLEEKSVVPHTWGPHKTPTGESCLVAFFSDGQQVQRAKAFINSLKIENPDCLLLMSKEIQMQQAGAEHVFKTNSYNSVVQRGLVVGLQCSGPNCIQSCQKVAVRIATGMGSTGLVYVSTNPKISQQQVDSFFNFANMQFVA